MHGLGLVANIFIPLNALKFFFVRLMPKPVITAGKRVFITMDSKLKPFHGARIPAQIRLERICINSKSIKQDSPMWIQTGMTILCARARIFRAMSGDNYLGGGKNKFKVFIW